MSRVGKEPIIIPDKVKVDIKGHNVKVTGPLGELKHILNDNITAKIKDNEIIVERKSDEKEIRSLHGLNRSLIANMVKGVSEGYLKKLMIVGTGYKAEIKGKWLVLSLGFSHDVYLEIPKEVKVDIEKIGRAEASSLPGLQAIIDFRSYNKEMLGAFCATIRNVKPPEPYKGKGIRYSDEHIHIKPGKVAGGAGA
ncbi:MAG TPA: 50S ribosomal protein L6 [Candidatus Cloacimonetes bacterium]|nr:50S ribosomal protein L6 [Candidatus Cloacimonadota bacterium]HEX37890.1 50S ribosomal protein L6 [Candidatus Cloacimonadota bacterium]